MSCPSAYYCHVWRIYQYVVIAILNSTFVLSVGRDYTVLRVTQSNISRRLAPKPLKRAVYVGTGLGAELILITHTDGVAGVWFTPALACLYQHDNYVKNRCSWYQQTRHTNVPRRVLETGLFCGQKVKITSHNNIVFALL